MSDIGYCDSKLSRTSANSLGFETLETAKAIRRLAAIIKNFGVSHTLKIHKYNNINSL